MAKLRLRIKQKLEQPFGAIEIPDDWAIGELKEDFICPLCVVNVVWEPKPC